MLKIVLDTNVIISGLGWSGKPREILNLFKARKLKLYVSEEIISEYWRVASRGELPEKATSILASLLQEGELVLVEPREHFTIIKEDSDDNIFLNCAVEGKVKYIISGDKHLLDLKKFKAIKIISPETFLKEIS